MTGKNVIKGLLKYLTDKDYRFVKNASIGTCNHMADEEYLRRMFRIKLGYELDLSNPVTFNEKLQWLKLHNRKPEYTRMVDKYEAKDYVAGIIGKEYIIPNIGVWDSAEAIDFEILPERFVLKCTHDSHGVYICKRKKNYDFKAVKKKINRALGINYYYRFREWPYKDVRPRIIAEKYMEDSETSELMDYKFFCFNGKVKCFKIDFDRFTNHHANYYDREAQPLEIGEVICPPNPGKNLKIPTNIMKMVELAEMLSTGIPFVRVDFYYVDMKIYFGELTFFPASGFGKFFYNGNDELLGSWLRLPEHAVN